MLNFENKVAFVTGGGGFIGSETCKTLARQGATVAVADINTETAQRTVDAILAEGGKAKAYAIDVTLSESVDAVIAQVVADFGRLDISVHVAGGSARIASTPERPARYCNLVEQEDFVIDTVIKVNLYGAIYVARAAARQMIKQGEGGRIISFASAVGFNGLSGSVDYAASKGGVMSFTKSLAKEVGRYKITVNAVAPGVVSRNDPDASAGAHKYAYGTNFLGEMCTAKDIADLVTFVASDEARFITGQTYLIDGGRTLAMKGSDGD